MDAATSGVQASNQTMVTFLTQVSPTSPPMTEQRVFDFEITREAQAYYLEQMSIIQYALLDGRSWTPTGGVGGPLTDTQVFDTVRAAIGALNAWSRYKYVDANGIQQENPLSCPFSTLSTMSRYMAQGLDTLIRTMSAAGINPLEQSPIYANWAAPLAAIRSDDLSSTPVYNLRSVLSTSMSSAANAVIAGEYSTQSQSIQQLLMVDYVASGNEILYGQMNQLQTAVNLNQQILSYLNSLQDLMNQKDPQHFLMNLQQLNSTSPNYALFEKQSFGEQVLGTTPKFTEAQLSKYITLLALQNQGVDTNDPLIQAEYNLVATDAQLMQVFKALYDRQILTASNTSNWTVFPTEVSLKYHMTETQQTLFLAYAQKADGLIAAPTTIEEIWTSLGLAPPASMYTNSLLYQLIMPNDEGVAVLNYENTEGYTVLPDDVIEDYNLYYAPYNVLQPLFLHFLQLVNPPSTLATLLKYQGIDLSTPFAQQDFNLISSDEELLAFFLAIPISDRSDLRYSPQTRQAFVAEHNLSAGAAALLYQFVLEFTYASPTLANFYSELGSTSFQEYLDTRSPPIVDTLYASHTTATDLFTLFQTSLKNGLTTLPAGASSAQQTSYADYVARAQVGGAAIVTELSDIGPIPGDLYTNAIADGGDSIITLYKTLCTVINPQTSTPILNSFNTLNYTVFPTFTSADLVNLTEADRTLLGTLSSGTKAVALQYLKSFGPTIISSFVSSIEPTTDALTLGRLNLIENDEQFLALMKSMRAAGMFTPWGVSDENKSLYSLSDEHLDIISIYRGYMNAYPTGDPTVRDLIEYAYNTHPWGSPPVDATFDTVVQRLSQWGVAPPLYSTRITDLTDIRLLAEANLISTDDQLYDLFCTILYEFYTPMDPYINDKLDWMTAKYRLSADQRSALNSFINTYSVRSTVSIPSKEEWFQEMQIEWSETATLADKTDYFGNKIFLDIYDSSNVLLFQKKSLDPSSVTFPALSPAIDEMLYSLYSGLASTDLFRNAIMTIEGITDPSLFDTNPALKAKYNLIDSDDEFFDLIRLLTDSSTGPAIISFTTTNGYTQIPAAVAALYSLSPAQQTMILQYLQKVGPQPQIRPLLDYEGLVRDIKAIANLKLITSDEDLFDLTVALTTGPSPVLTKSNTNGFTAISGSTKTTYNINANQEKVILQYMRLVSPEAPTTMGELRALFPSLPAPTYSTEGANPFPLGADSITVLMTLHSSGLDVNDPAIQAQYNLTQQDVLDYQIIVSILDAGLDPKDPEVQTAYRLVPRSLSYPGTAPEAFVDIVSGVFNGADGWQQIINNLQALIDKARQYVDPQAGSSVVTELQRVLLDFQGAATIENWVRNFSNQNEGQYQAHLNNAITASQSLNDTEREQLQQVMFVYQQFYQSATSMLNALNQLLQTIASNISSR